MPQRYTTLSAGCIYNNFGPLYTRVGALPYNIYTHITYVPSEPNLRKIFPAAFFIYKICTA